MQEITIETNLYTANGNKFVAPMSYENVLKEIAENDGKITLVRYAVVQRTITDAAGNQTQIASNAKFTTILDTNISAIAAYEEVHMTDIAKTEETE